MSSWAGRAAREQVALTITLRRRADVASLCPHLVELLAAVQPAVTERRAVLVSGCSTAA